MLKKMDKKIPSKNSPVKRDELREYISDIQYLAAMPVNKKYRRWELIEYPFDGQLLTASELYRFSRRNFLSLGGEFVPKVCSVMRSLSAHDLFQDQIEYTPAATEVLWFGTHESEVPFPNDNMQALSAINGISLFHEQNHRIIWRLLPPAPWTDKLKISPVESEELRADLRRYLNFAESLVVCLDLALGDQLGFKNSEIFERLKLIYRSGGRDLWAKRGAAKKLDYRAYLLALLATTYLTLELVDVRDILKAVNYLLPNQAKINRVAVERGLELSDFFTQNTNPQWQQVNWKKAGEKLANLHRDSSEQALYLAVDPLDLEEEFILAQRIFDYFGI